MNVDAFENYLASSGRAPSTVAAYGRFVSDYCGELGDAEAAGRADVVSYLGVLRERGLASATRATRLAAIKSYYDYLVVSGVRQDHPCAKLTLRTEATSEHIDASRLYTREQLVGLLHELGDPSDEAGMLRAVLAGLLCHQALAPAEVCALTLEAIDLGGGSLRAPGTRTVDARVLPLRAGQVMMLAGYLEDVRPGLVGSGVRGAWAEASTSRGEGVPNTLLVSRWGRPLLRQKLSTILNGSRARELWLLPQRIRGSVIAHLLAAGYDVSVVQAFAGHRYPSTTARYSAVGLRELAAVVRRLHPRG